MKSLKRQYVIRLLMTWLIAAGTLFLLLLFFGGKLQDEIVKACYINSAWKTLSGMDMNDLTGEAYENSEKEETLEELEEDVRLLICGEDGEALYAGEGVRYTEELYKIISEEDRFLEDPAPVKERDGNRETIVLRGKLVSDGKPYYVLIYKNMAHLRTRLAQAETVTLYVLLASTVLFVLLALEAWKKPEDSLHVIENQLDSIASGNYSGRIAVQGENELSRIVDHVNKIADTIQNHDTELENYRFLVSNDAVQRKRLDTMDREMARDITHQLKTPLAIISSQVELNQYETDEVKRAYYYESIMEEIDKMSALITRILMEEQNPGSSGKIVLRRISLSDLLSELVPKYESWMKKNRIQFSAKIAPQIYIVADAALIEQAVHNYIMNAYSHTRPDRKIVLSLRPYGEDCMIGIYNDGAGIAEAEKEWIWERGYRSEEKDVAGSGLGLYISREIVTIHGGSCGSENELSGVTFWMRLPVSSLEKQSNVSDAHISPTFT